MHWFLNIFVLNSGNGFYVRIRFFFFTIARSLEIDFIEGIELPFLMNELFRCSFWKIIGKFRCELFYCYWCWYCLKTNIDFAFLIAGKIFISFEQTEYLQKLKVKLGLNFWSYRPKPPILNTVRLKYTHKKHGLLTIFFFLQKFDIWIRSWIKHYFGKKIVF